MTEFLNDLKLKNENEIIKILLNKINHLNERYSNPPEVIIEQILQIASYQIHLFNLPDIYNILISWLKTSNYITIYKKNKILSNSKNSLSRVAGRIVIEILKNKLSWPLDLLNIYLDDALGCRQWVDAPELSFLTKNLIEWTNYAILSSNMFNTSFIEEDDSSGEEEILDASTNSTNNGILSDICDRFQGRHNEALNIIFSTLANRCGLEVNKISLNSPKEYTQIIHSLNPSSTSLMNASSVLITTMQSFYLLPPIRFLATKCMSIWITNPALVEYVGRLLFQIGQGLQSYSSEISKIGILESDMHVIEAIIKLRPSLKLSLAEVHRNILMTVAPLSPHIATLITRLHLVENLLGRGNKPDSIKLLTQILSSLHDNDKLLTFVPFHQCPGNCQLLFESTIIPTSSSSSSSSSISYEYVSMILGISIRQIITQDILLAFDPTDFKTIHEDILKIIRHLNIGLICPTLLFNQIFTNNVITNQLAYSPVMSPIEQNYFELLSCDGVRFLSDLSLSIQLLYLNSIVIADRAEKDDKRPNSSNQSINNNNTNNNGNNNNNNNGINNSSISIINHEVGGRGINRGNVINSNTVNVNSNITNGINNNSNNISNNNNNQSNSISGRGISGRGVLGRGSNVVVPEGSSMFRSTNKINSLSSGGGRGRGIPGRGGLGISNNLKSSNDRESVVNEQPLTSVLGGSTSLESSSLSTSTINHEFDKEIYQKIKDNFHLKSSYIREISLKWFNEYLFQLIKLFRDELNVNDGGKQNLHLSTTPASTPTPVPTLTLTPIQSQPNLLQPPPQLINYHTLKLIDENSNDGLDLPPNLTRKRSNSTGSIDTIVSQTSNIPIITTTSSSSTITTTTTGMINTSSFINGQNKYLIGINLPFLIDRFQQFNCCLNLQVTTKVNLDLDKMTLLFARDNQILTTKSFTLLIDCLILLCNLDHILITLQVAKLKQKIIYSTEMKSNKRTELSFLSSLINNMNAIQSLTSTSSSSSSSTNNNIDTVSFQQYQTYNGIPLILSAIEFIEHCIHKAMKTKYLNNLGLIVNDILVIQKLFTFCRVQIFDDSNIQSATIIPELTTSLNILGIGSLDENQTLLQIKDCIGYKDIYWKVCSICYLLGCASPKIIGSYVWKNFPSIQSLLLMSISDRFFYPPSFSNITLQSMNVNIESIEEISSIPSLFNGYELFNRSNSSKLSNEGNFILEQINSKCQYISNQMKSVQTIYDGDQFIKQEEAYIWELIFNHRIIFQNNNLIEEGIELNSKKSIDLKEEKNEDENLSIDENESIEKLNKKRIRSQSKKNKQKVKKRIKVATKSIDDKNQSVLNESNIKLNQDNNNIIINENENENEVVSVRRSARKHVARFNIRELMKDDSTSSEESESEFIENNHLEDGEVDDDDHDDNDNDANDDNDDYLDNIHNNENNINIVNSSEDETSNNRKNNNRNQKNNHSNKIDEDNEYEYDSGYELPKRKRKETKKKTRGISKKLKDVTITIPKYNQYVTRNGIPSKQDIIFLPCQLVSRVPPDEIIKVIKQYNLKYKFGKSLRLCLEPDFIASVAGGNNNVDNNNVDNKNNNENNSKDSLNLISYITKREEIIESVGWLVPAINAEMESNLLQRIPYSACIHMLLIILYQNCCHFVDYVVYDENILSDILFYSLNNVKLKDNEESSNKNKEILSKLSSSQINILNSKGQTEDLFLCSQIIEKILNLFQSSLFRLFNINSIDDFEILISTIIILLYEANFDHFQTNININININTLKLKLKTISQTNSFYHCGVVLGLIFQDLINENWLRRSIARIILSFLTYKIKLFKLQQVNLEFDLNDSCYFLQIFNLFPESITSNLSCNSLLTSLYQIISCSICKIEIHRPTLCYLLYNSKKSWISCYSFLGFELIKRLKYNSRFICDLFRNNDETQDPLLILFTDVLESIQETKEFGSIVILNENITTEDYFQFQEKSVLIRNEFGILCGELLLLSLLDETKTNKVSVYSQIFFSFISQFNITDKISYQSFFKNIVQCNNFDFCNEFISRINLSSILYLFDKYVNEMSINFSKSFLIYLEKSCSNIVSIIDPNNNTISFEEELQKRNTVISNHCSIMMMLDKNIKLDNLLKKLNILNNEIKKSSSIILKESISDMEIQQNNYNKNNLFDQYKEILNLILSKTLLSDKLTAITNYFNQISFNEDEKISVKITEIFCYSLLNDLEQFSNNFDNIVEIFEVFISWIYSKSLLKSPIHIFVDILSNLITLYFNYHNKKEQQEQLDFIIHYSINFVVNSNFNQISDLWDLIYKKWYLNQESIYHVYMIMITLKYFFLIKSNILRCINSFALHPNLPSKLLVNDCSDVTDEFILQIIQFIGYFSKNISSLTNYVSKNTLSLSIIFKCHYDFIINCICILCSEEIVFAKKFLFHSFQLFLSFPNKFLKSTIDIDNFNFMIFRKILYHIYLSFPENINKWLTNKVQENQYEYQYENKQNLLLLLNLLIIKENMMNHKLRLKFDTKITSLLELFEDRNYFSSIENGTDLYTEIEQIFKLIGKNHPVLFLKYHKVFESYLLKSPIGQPIQKLSLSSSSSSSLLSSSLSLSSLSNTNKFPNFLLHQPGATIITSMEEMCNPPPLQVLMNNNNNNTNQNNTNNNQNNKDKDKDKGYKNVYFTAKGADLNMYLWECVLNSYNSVNPLIYYLSNQSIEEYSLSSSQKLFLEYSKRRSEFHNLMTITPSFNSQIDILLSECIEKFSNERVEIQKDCDKQIESYCKILPIYTLEMIGLKNNKEK